MNETEWLTGADFVAHVRFVLGRLSPRRRRLLAVGFCRAAGELLDHPDLTDALDVVERYADGLVPAGVLERARYECREVAQQAYDAYSAAIDAGGEGALKHSVRSALAWAASFAATSPLPVELVGTNVLSAVAQARTRTIELVPVSTAEFNAALAAQHRVMRAVVWEVVGNPFRAARFAPEGRTDTAVSLARQMYESRDFSAMPILADALQDAGCDDDALLAHCRGEGVHARGCWAVDAVLGLS